jgi:NAD(P)-dependent dehydrogenase (short-subunit alcohol dehydrogenase family)
MADYDYSDKVALVTGAGSGIDEACALTFAPFRGQGDRRRL